MKLKTVGLAVLVTAALSAGSALAQMQPIPNPPEKPKAVGKHHMKHHKHHAMHHKAMKSEAKADMKGDKAAMKSDKAGSAAMSTTAPPKK